MRAVIVAAVIGSLLLSACSPMVGPDEGGAPSENDAGIWYVDERAPPGGDGTSWATAFVHPQQAVDAAAADEAVKVAQGVYFPWSENEGNAVIAMKARVEIYGGYYVESGEMMLRDPLSYPSMLVGSGEMAIGRESKHIVLGASNALLDGFEVSDGMATLETSDLSDYADPTEHSDPWGAGMFNESVRNLVVQNCNFRTNVAEAGGAAICNVDSTVYVRRCQFWLNTSDRLAAGAPDAGPGNYGGAIAVWDGSLELVNSLFVRNSASIHVSDVEGYGGVLATRADGDADVVNCTCSGGYADYGLMLYDEPDDDGEIVLKNSILWSGAHDTIRRIDPADFDNVSYSNVELIDGQRSYSDPETLSQNPEFYYTTVQDAPWLWSSFRIPEFGPCCNAVPAGEAPLLDFTGSIRNGGDGSVQMGALEEPYIASGE